MITRETKGSKKGVLLATIGLVTLAGCNIEGVRTKKPPTTIDIPREVPIHSTPTPNVSRWLSETEISDITISGILKREDSDTSAGFIDAEVLNKSDKHISIVRYRFYMQDVRDNHEVVSRKGEIEVSLPPGQSASRGIVIRNLPDFCWNRSLDMPTNENSHTHTHSDGNDEDTTVESNNGSTHSDYQWGIEVVGAYYKTNADRAHTRAKRRRLRRILESRHRRLEEARYTSITTGLLDELFPGCIVTFDQSRSGADGHFQTYIVKNQRGSWFYASFSFVPDPGQDYICEANKTGHFTLQCSHYHNWSNE